MMSSSGRALAEPSTMTTASRVLLTTMSSSLAARCSYVGLMMNSSFTRPTRQLPVGPWKGAWLMLRAAEEPIMPRMSGSFSVSALSTQAKTCTSSWYPSGKRGRRGLSIRRQVSTSLCVGRPSRLMMPPGNCPAAYCFSRYSTLSGKKSTPRMSGTAIAVDRTTLSP